MRIQCVSSLHPIIVLLLNRRLTRNLHENVAHLLLWCVKQFPQFFVRFQYWILFVFTVQL